MYVQSFTSLIVISSLQTSISCNVNSHFQDDQSAAARGARIHTIRAGIAKLGAGMSVFVVDINLVRWEREENLENTPDRYLPTAQANTALASGHEGFITTLTPLHP